MQRRSDLFGSHSASPLRSDPIGTEPPVPQYGYGVYTQHVPTASPTSKPTRPPPAARSSPILTATNSLPRGHLSARKHIVRKKKKGGSSSGRTSTGTRGTRFSQQELDSLLELLDEQLPLCKEEWVAVLSRHEKRYPGLKRTVDSLKRTFAALHRKKMPTGDPIMPPDVQSESDSIQNDRAC